jgi:acetate kinase
VKASVKQEAPSSVRWSSSQAMKHILVFNYGSSSLKYALFEQLQAKVRESVKIDGIEDCQKVVRQVIANIERIDAIAHRVVHGMDLDSPLPINEETIEKLRSLVSLSPLHNSLALAGIEVCLQELPQVPQYAIFDTSFFRELPFTSRAYALPLEFYERGIKRYGFHGISYSYLLKETARLLGKELKGLSAIMLHLGSGASACAVYKGKPIDTSMGMTPLEGLVMSSRAGDLDPGILLHLLREKSLEDLEHLLYNECGVKGLTGSKDIGKIVKQAQEGDPISQRALELYVYRIKKYIGAYYAVLPEVDALVFSGGVGENSPVVRELVCKGLEKLGIVLDEGLNKGKDLPLFINSPDSKLKILVIKTDEELEMARQLLERV